MTPGVAPGGASAAASAPVAWSDAALDACRTVGDPLADDLIAEIFADGDVGPVRALLRHLVDNDALLPASHDLPPHLVRHVERYLELSDASLPRIDPAAIVAGQRMFELHGPEILMTLGCYSLPASYTASKGVQVLAQTGRLESDPKRRLIETTQMVIDVMTPGGLTIGARHEQHGKGIRTAQKVRLMHAAIRKLVVAHGGQKWLDAYDVPINQEDLAGTLMTFSRVVIDGLDRLGAVTTPADRASYFEAWRAIGTIMGVRDALVPPDLEQARILTDIIKRRQSARSDAGDAMVAALLAMMRAQVPGVLGGLPATLVRFFLQQDAALLAMPPADWTRILVAVIHGATRLVDTIIGGWGVSRWLYRAFNRRLLAGFMRVERGPGRPSFDIPDHLADGWGMKDAAPMKSPR